MRKTMGSEGRRSSVRGPDAIQGEGRVTHCWTVYFSIPEPGTPLGPRSPQEKGTL